MSEEPLSFKIEAKDFDLSLLPATAQSVGGPEFREAVSRFFHESFAGTKGSAEIKVTPDVIEVAWSRTPVTKPLDWALSLLRASRLKEGIQALRLLLSRDPDDEILLFNLGVALNEIGEFTEAAIALQRAVAADPDHPHAPVALAVALSRTGRNDEAVEVLQDCVLRQPEDPWSRLNLGATLMKQNRHPEAVEHLERATVLQPENVRAWLGFGDALREVSRAGEAQDAYRKVIELEPHTEAAGLARDGLSRLAQSSFQAKKSGEVRMDAVEYCLAALKEFGPRTAEEVQEIVLEITALGDRGLDTNSTDKKYALRKLPGKFSGLELVCLMYVGLKQVAPEADIGFDLSREYAAAREMFGQQL
ncbi:MAG: Flp pilus assembly protein TadD [Planctomycetota bacterium]|jgi:Flp pilus assembly protein TadD